jgi:hypothetical protein
MRNGFQASPVMTMTGSQFLEEGPEVAGVAAIDLNPGRLTLMFGQPHYGDLFFAFSVVAIPHKSSGHGYWVSFAREVVLTAVKFPAPSAPHSVQKTIPSSAGGAYAGSMSFGEMRFDRFARARTGLPRACGGSLCRWPVVLAR